MDNEVIELSNRPEVRSLLVHVGGLESMVKAMVVRNPREFEMAGSTLKEIKGAQKQLEDMRTKITKPMNDALKEVNNLFRMPGDRLAQAERAVKERLADYQTEQERIAREQQDKLNAAARKEQERLQELARKAEESGRLDAAAKHAERAAAVVAPTVEVNAPAVEGVSMRTVWKFAIEDAAIVPRPFLSVDESKIGRYVTAMKGDAKIEGVRIWSEKQIAAGSR